MVVGVLLVVLALREWRERRGNGDRAELPKWIAGVDSMTPGKALVLGLLLSAVVPKNLLLVLSAGLIVGEAGFSGSRAAVVIVLFTVIATSTVAAPVSLTSWHRRECAGVRGTAGVADGEECDDHGRGSARHRSCHDRQ